VGGGHSGAQKRKGGAGAGRPERGGGWAGGGRGWCMFEGRMTGPQASRGRESAGV